MNPREVHAVVPVSASPHAASAASIGRMIGAVLLLLPVPLLAQGAAQAGGPGARTRAVAVTNACAELASSPSSLVLLPEGLALLRLKRELESAALTLERQPLRTTEVQRITQVQRGVDSLMRVMVRVHRDDGMMGPPMSAMSPMSPMPSGPISGTITAATTRRGDSVRVTVNGSPFDGRLFFEMADSARGTMPQVAMIIRALQPQVAAVSEAAEARLAEMRPAMGAASIGYVGVSLSGAQLRAVTPGGVMTSHCEYPLVESVDAGSPAERAGIAAGDTLVAYNGRDVLQVAVNYPELFTAGQQVRVRVRRSGRARELPVSVVPRAEERAMMFVRSYGGEGPSGPTGRVFITQTAPGATVPTGGVAGRPGLPGAQLTNFAGAQFTTIDDDFAQTIGLDAGVLVLRAPMGTPAADAGLRGGEIVRAVNGTPVRDAGALLRLLVNSGHEAKLLVQSRANGERVLTLKLK